MIGEILQLIKKDRLEKAIEQLEKKGYSLSPDVQSCKDRLDTLKTQLQQGILEPRQLYSERKKIRKMLQKAVKELEFAPATDPPFYEKYQIFIILFVIVVAAVLFAWYYLRTMYPERVDLAPSVLPPIQSELADKDHELVKDDLYFAEIKEYHRTNAFLKRKYSWKVRQPFLLEKGMIHLEYFEAENRIIVTVDEYRIPGQFQIDDRKATTLERRNWEEEKSNDEAFWKQINEITASRINRLLSSDGAEREAIIKAVNAALRNKVGRMVETRIRPGIRIEIVAKAIHLENEKRYILAEDGHQ